MNTNESHTTGAINPFSAPPSGVDRDLPSPPGGAGFQPAQIEQAGSPLHDPVHGEGGRRPDEVRRSNLECAPGELSIRPGSFSDAKTRQKLRDELRAEEWAMHCELMANSDRVNGWAAILQRFGDPDAGIRPTLFIHTRCARLIDCIANLQHDPARPEDVLKVDTDDGGIGGDDPADALRYLIATRPNYVYVRKLTGY
jgi:hypothetical protein